MKEIIIVYFAHYEFFVAEADVTLTYEEVGAYRPVPDKRRPIVLVGCDELRLQRMCDRMVRLNNGKFAQPIRSMCLT